MDKNTVTQEQVKDAILLTTGSPQWEIIQKGLLNEIQNSHSNVFHLKSWEDVCEERGFVRGLYYVLTMRQQVLAQDEQADANV